MRPTVKPTCSSPSTTRARREGTPDGATLEQEVAAAPVFAAIVNETSPWSMRSSPVTPTRRTPGTAPIPGQPGKTRPIVQTGQLRRERRQDRADRRPRQPRRHRLHRRRNVPGPRRPTRTLVAQYPRVAAVKTIVDAALAIRRTWSATSRSARSRPTSPPRSRRRLHRPAYATPVARRDDRAKESTLGDLVANALLDSLADPSPGRRRDRRRQPGRPARRAALRARRCGHLRRGERGAAVRQQPVDHAR